MRSLIALVILPLLLSIQQPASNISVDRLQETVEWLSDPARGGRLSQSAGAQETSDWLLSKFQDRGLTAQMQEIGPSRRNVIGRWGDGDQHLIVGAHYDGQGIGYSSASDNAAGVAVLLEFARELQRRDAKGSYVFIAFDDEERGLFGSHHYVNNPVYPLENASAVVILDTMGRSFADLNQWTLVVFGSEFSPELSQVLADLRKPEMILLGTDLLGPRSDFAPFAGKNIPYLFFTNATHRDYHGVGDVPGSIQYDRLRDDADTILEIVNKISNLKFKTTYLDDPEYPANEGNAIKALLNAIESTRNDLSHVYKLLFEDLRKRLAIDSSRENLRLATSVLLACATPRVSSFSLGYLIGPLYEAEGKPQIAVAVYEEALRWTTNPFLKKSLSDKLESLLQ